MRVLYNRNEMVVFRLMGKYNNSLYYSTDSNRFMFFQQFKLDLGLVRNLKIQNTRLAQTNAKPSALSLLNGSRPPLRERNLQSIESFFISVAPLIGSLQLECPHNIDVICLHINKAQNPSDYQHCRQFLASRPLQLYRQFSIIAASE